MNNYLSPNILSVNIEKINVIILITKNSTQYPLNTGYNDKYIQEAVNAKLRGLKTDKLLNSTTHIHELVPKLSRACYAVSSTLHYQQH
jgi:hypothetical protein